MAFLQKLTGINAYSMGGMITGLYHLLKLRFLAQAG